MTYWKTWKEAMFNPTEFFEKIPKEVKYKEPTIFYLKTIAWGLLFAYILFLPLAIFFVSVFGSVFPPEIAVLFDGIGILVILFLAVLLFPLVILVSWASLYINAGLLHLFISIFGGKQGFVETFKSFSYAAAPYVGGFIPLLHYAAAIYTLVLQVIGLHVRQKISIGRTIGAIATLVVVAIVLSFLIMFPFMLIGAV